MYTENMKEEEEKKMIRHLIILLMTGRLYKVLAEKLLDGS